MILIEKSFSIYDPLKSYQDFIHDKKKLIDDMMLKIGEYSKNITNVEALEMMDMGSIVSYYESEIISLKDKIYDVKESIKSNEKLIEEEKILYEYYLKDLEIRYQNGLKDIQVYYPDVINVHYARSTLYPDRLLSVHTLLPFSHDRRYDYEAWKRDGRRV